MRKTEVAAVTQEIRVVRAQRRQLRPDGPIDAPSAQYLDGVIDGLKRALNVARQARSRPGR